MNFKMNEDTESEPTLKLEATLRIIRTQIFPALKDMIEKA